MPHNPVHNPIVILPARMASTRLPGKMLADIHGLPLIVHAWKRAAEAGVGPVYVACDSEEIKRAVEAAGGKAVLTDPEHPSGSDRVFEALQVIDPDRKYDVVINLQGDMPTLDPVIVHEVLKPLSKGFDIATLATEIRREEEKTNPAVVKAVLSFGQTPNIARALYFTRATAPSGEGPLYHHIGLYAYRREALEAFVKLPPSALEKREKLEQLRALENNLSIGACLVDTVPLGVDTAPQLEEARQLLG